jgi:glycosyltransferase involved in cell wall biosynthesis
LSGTDFSDVAVAIITRNEEKAIAKVIGDVKSALPGAKVYVVDDSTDRTKDVAAGMGAIVSDGPRRGFGPAFHQALLTPPEPIIVTVDADDTYPVDVFPVLIDLVRRGVDVAGANRLGFGRPSTMPLANYLINVVLSKIASVRSRSKVLDVHSGQRAYRRDVLHAFSWRFDFEAFPIDLIFIPATCGYSVVEVPIAYRERIGETTLERWPSGKASLKRLTRRKRSIRNSLLIPPRA